ncbi:MAG: prolyl oligopeptidase family serine peptidase [Prevotellaceae bacterium]|nr:prolyl oligopeptidase family serine peptidase [Prevotellaceae bacterium]
MSACVRRPEKITYPDTKKTAQKDIYFGKEIADPYRWLEDDRSDETAEWVKAENEVTLKYLSQIPFREDVKNSLTKIWNYPRQGLPFKVGEKYLVWKNDGLQNQSVLYVMDTLDGEPREFINPNALSNEGTTAVGGLSASKDKKYIAYTTSVGGSDWKEIHVKDIAGNDLPDVIQWVKFTGISWDGNGFYYSGYDAPKGSALSQKNEDNKIYYHKIGDKQSQDQLIYEDPKNPLRYNTTEASDDGRFLWLIVSGGTSGNALSVKDLRQLKDLKQSGSTFRPIVSGFDYDYVPIGNFENELYVLTNEGAPYNKLVKIDPTAPKLEWKTVIPEVEHVLQSVDIIGGKLVVQYMQDAHSVMYIYDKSGQYETEVKLPEIGSIAGISGDCDDHEMFFGFTSFTTLNDMYRMDIANPQPELYKSVTLSVKTGKYVTEQVFYESKDGTKIPMYIIYKEGTKRNGKNPTMLYGYGGFNISLLPGFSITRMFFLEQGGVYAIANLRGGGEYGEEWHKAGTKLQKQNVFDDFIAAAEYLIAEKYTSAEKLAILGGSNGGLLMGACMTQRPELFKVVLPAVGVMDMLRFHKFTVGWGWVSDYGSSDDEAEFNYLLGYSPLHNIKAGTCYPATLVTTADHDDRVVPAHSFKFTAAMQAAQGCDNPVLIRVETMAGHGGGKPTSKAIEEEADILAFTFYHLGMKPKK